MMAQHLPMGEKYLKIWKAFPRNVDDKYNSNVHVFPPGGLTQLREVPHHGKTRVNNHQ